MPKRRTEHVSVLALAVLRRFLFAFFFAALVFMVIVVVIYRQDVHHQRAMLERESDYITDMQQELLSFEFRAVESDLLFLATQDRLAQFLSGDTSARNKLEREYVSFARSKAVYDQIRCLDTSGREVIRVNHRNGNTDIVPPDELQNKATRYYYRQALSLEKGGVFVSPFDLNVERGQIEQPIKPVIRFLTPVFDESGEKRGLLVLNYLGAHLLSKLEQVSAGFRGQTMLLNPAGEYLQAPDRSHAWGWLLNHKHSFRGDFPDAWEQCLRRKEKRYRVGEKRFTFQWVSPGRPSAAVQTSSAAAVDDRGPNSLVLVSYVSSSVANAHSRELLNGLMLMYIGVMAAVALLSLYWARSGIIRKHHEQQIAESESRLRQLSSLLLAAQETERRNLSRDLHDELGQQVTAISLDLRSLEKDDDGAHSNPLLLRAIDETDQLLKSLHEIATRVRPSVLDDLGLRDAVESFLSEYQQRTGVTVCARLQFDRVNIPATVAENVYRILQESLANVAEHAQVSEVEATIETDNDLLRMSVQDAGIGFDPEENTARTRLGILGMRERAELLNGQFELHSAPNAGTRVSISIPLRANEQ